MVGDYIGFIGTLLYSCFNIVLPYGIAFGSIVVAVFGLPILARAIKKLF